MALQLIRLSNFLFFIFLTGFFFFFSGEWNAHGQSSQAPSEPDYYPIDPIPAPEGVVLEASGLAFGDQGELMVTTRRGEVWRIGNPGGNSPSFDRFAQGLNEPLGIAYREGAWFVAQMGELTKLEDRNNDGKADRFQTVYRWPLSGNFHEYSYGPVILPSGEMAVTLNLTMPGFPASLAKWRGWMLHITEDGQMTPHATGLRSPNGIGLNADGDIFYGDNEGRWIGSGWITHLERGDFAGQPYGLRWTHLPESPLNLKFDVINTIEDRPWRPMHEYARAIPEMKLPAVWIPHPILGVSTSDILLIEHDNQVGPFTGQLLVGDFGHAAINRVYLEKVKGEYQGAVFRFRDGFSSGVNKLGWGPDDKLYVAMSDRGFGSAGQGPDGVDRMSWNGQIPFEMKSIRAESNGFTITFTKPVEVQSAGDITSYQVTDFTYPYHRRYYSSIINRENKIIARVEVSNDRRSVRLYVDGLREGYINEVKAGGVQSAEGTGLLHPVGYYTLNNLPVGEHSVAVAEPGANASGSERATAESPKKITQMPADWAEGPDQTVQLGAGPGLRFDREVITVVADSRVALVLTNNDGMQHNVVIVEPGAADAVGRGALQLGLDAEALEYVPRMDEVLYHSSLVGSSGSETIYFQVPDTPGEYEFVCTFAGHYTTMKGILQVVEQ